MGWTADATLGTSIFILEAAIDAKMGFLRATVPGFAEAQEQAKEGGKPPVKDDGSLDRDAVADRVRDMFGVKGKGAR